MEQKKFGVMKKMAAEISHNPSVIQKYIGNADTNLIILIMFGGVSSRFKL